MGTVDCPFCHPSPEHIVERNKWCYLRFDKYPVNRGHLLIIPFRHFSSYFEATREEKAAILDLVDRSKQIIDEKFHPNGYNIGLNVGLSAGQTVQHLHVHFIPRYDGDVEDPRGGVRGVIPEKQQY